MAADSLQPERLEALPPVQYKIPSNASAEADYLEKVLLAEGRDPSGEVTKVLSRCAFQSELKLGSTTTSFLSRWGNLNLQIEPPHDRLIDLLLGVGSRDEEAMRGKPLERDEQLVGDPADLRHIVASAPLYCYPIELVQEHNAWC